MSNMLRRFVATWSSIKNCSKCNWWIVFANCSSFLAKSAINIYGLLPSNMAILYRGYFC